MTSQAVRLTASEIEHCHYEARIAAHDAVSEDSENGVNHAAAAQIANAKTAAILGLRKHNAECLPHAVISLKEHKILWCTEYAHHFHSVYQSYGKVLRARLSA